MAEETQKPAAPPAKAAAHETVQSAQRTEKAVDKESEKAAQDKPLERKTGQDFEVGGEEEPGFLSGGGTVGRGRPAVAGPGRQVRLRAG